MKFTMISTLILAAAAVGLGFTAYNASTKTIVDQAARNKATIQRSFDAWAAGTGSPYDLLADDATWTITGRSLESKTYPNREAFLNEVIRPFNARMREPLKPNVRSIYAEGDVVIILFDASGVARDGAPYTNTYTWYLRLRGDRIVSATAFFDNIAFNELWTRVAPSP